jgi:adenylate kinase family enzyme
VDRIGALRDWVDNLGDAWIVDGNYNETLLLRLERAEAVIYLDSPWWLCASRAFMRGLRTPGGEMPEGCVDSRFRRLRDEWGGVGRIWRNRDSEPEAVRSEILRYGSDTTLHTLRSRREAREFLDAVGRPAQ